MKFLLKGVFFIFLLVTFFAGLFFIISIFIKPATVMRYFQELRPTPTPASLHLTGIGIIGDSQSDEYRADDDRGIPYGITTLNWVELLVKYRNINVGEWGVWEEPRRGGFAYNYARSAATANSMLESGQHVGVAGHVASQEINLVIIYIGANDYAPFVTEDGYQAIYDGSVSDAELMRKNNRVVADITTAIDTVRAAGNVRIVLLKIPDWNNHVAIRTMFPFPDQRHRVSDAVTSVNAQLDKIATERKITVIDPNIFYDELFEQNTGTKLLVGNVGINRILPDNEPHSLFLNDGIHTGTVFNGLFANFMIRNLNQQLATNIRPFTDREILRAAGL